MNVRSELLVFDKLVAVHKDMDASTILDKFNIAPRNSIEKLYWLRCIHSKDSRA